MSRITHSALWKFNIFLSISRVFLRWRMAKVNSQIEWGPWPDLLPWIYHCLPTQNVDPTTEKAPSPWFRRVT